MRILRTQVVPGLPHAQNKTAFDWGLKGLVAYGCQSVVVVIEPRTVQPLQTLAHHKSNVVKVRWSNEKQHHTPASPYFLRLASVDSTSTCIVWDVGQAAVICEFSLGNKTLVDMQWLNGPAQDLLAVMLSPSSLTIWNAGTGTKVNRVTFSETIEAFTFSPFQPENLVLQSPDCFIFVNDFNPARTPTTGGGKKFYMTKSNRSSTPMPSHTKSPSPTWRLLSADNLKGEDSIPQVDCLQVTFSPAHQHHLLIVYPREIVIMDTAIHQAIGSVSLERNASPLLHVMPCQHRDVLFCLHENGCVSMRIRQNSQLPSTVPTSPLDPTVSGVSYNLCCFSEPLRISKMCSVFAGALCPISEKRVAVLTSEGRVLVWGVEFEQIGLYGQELSEDSIFLSFLSAYPVEAGLVDLEGAAGQDKPGERLTLADTIAPHWFSPPEGCTSSYALLTARFLLSGMWCGISGQTTALRMCPPLTTKNWTYYVPHVAVGTKGGIVYIVNLNIQTVVKEYAVHSCPVSGIEWLNQFSFVSWGSSSYNHNQLRNEIMVTDLLTGRITPLTREDAGKVGATPIETIRISSHKNYLVAKYKDRPLEFWDAKTFTFMRELVSNPPTFSCVEWYPTHGKPKVHKTDDALVDFDLAMGATDSKMTIFQEREVLNVMDETGSLWQISIEGSRVKVIKSTPYQLPLNNPSGMSFKGDLMASGDMDGNVAFLDSSQTRSLETPRGVVRKLRFAPGKGNFKLLILYANRLDIRDAQGDAVLGQLKWAQRDNNNHFSVEDADWATSDKPIVVSSDGCIRVYDTTLKTCNSVLNLLDTEEPVFCPHMVLPQACLRLKAMLQHQPWNLEYSLDPAEIEDPDNIEKAVKCQLELLPEEFRHNLLVADLGTPQRAIITASLYGDQRELDFWSVALYYILREKNRLEDPRYLVYKQSEPRQPDSDIIRPNSEASVSIVPSVSRKIEDFLGPLGDTSGAETPSPTSPTPSQPSSGKALPVTLSQRDIAAMMQETQLKTHSVLPPLDLCYNLFCDANTYQRVQLYRALLHDSKRQTYEQTRKCAETLLLLGQTDRAVQLLLETDSSSPEYYTDALKACLTATIRSSGASQSTIKLVATNLIANARLMDGVQLLCLIDKGLDGCRYLQTYGEWYSAAWLAKATLGEKDCSEVFSKWAEHLASVTVNQKEKALLVLLSLGNFLKIIEMLYGMRYFDQAAVFTEACLEYGVVKITEQTSPLIEAVFLEYARYLQSLGLTRGMRHYCGRAGEKGKKLLEQYHSSGLKMPASSDTGNAPT